VQFELSSGDNQMQAEVLCPQPEIPRYLINSSVRVRGICPDLKNAAGQGRAGAILVANWQDVRVLEVAPGQWSAFGSATIAELESKAPPNSGGLACLRGRLHFDPASQMLRFEDATGSASIELLGAAPVETNLNIECLSRWTREGSRLVLKEAVVRESADDREAKTNGLRVLTTAMQVQQLTRAEAEREYPVKIRGVVTSVSDDFKSFLIQDSSRAVFVWVGEHSPQDLPQTGDFCEIGGISRAADFSPIVLFSNAIVLWRGQMPQPVTSATRDQLLSGSLDGQYVEIRGLVVAAHDTYVTLLTSDGILNWDVTTAPSENWAALRNAIIRARGGLRANWDPETHRVILDQPIHLETAAVSIDSPPPADLFEASKLTARDLMQFDVHFDTFRRVKVAGQIIHGCLDTYYLMDGTTGLRFRLFEPAAFDPGDQVEVVGLVELGGASPVLRQAVARKTGHQPLPQPRQLSLNSLSNNYDSTLVSAEGTLVDIQNQGAEQVLELQVGVKNFMARLRSPQPAAPAWAVGSRLQLTGTFSALDGDRLTGRDVNSFELLLNTPADVRVIARPPWWTLGRLLAAVTCLLTGLAAAFVWITLLRRQVERRTQQLRREIGERERAEKMRAIEQERSRIARDLHDDLGSTLTEISMMATVSPGRAVGSETAADRLREIAEKSRSMVSALDGVVWVVNSKNDTLSCLIEYLASYTEEFLAKAQIACRIELPKNYPERMIAAEIRHEVMLAVREALNNAVRHGRPKVVLLRQIIAGNSLEILVQDDGCGFNPARVKGNGLENLQERMTKLNGSCQIQCPPEGGAAVLLKLPLPS